MQQVARHPPFQAAREPGRLPSTSAPEVRAPGRDGPLDPDDVAAWASSASGGLEAARELLRANGVLPDPNDDPRSPAEKRECLDQGMEAACDLVDDGLSIEEIEALLPGIEVRWAMRALTITPEPDGVRIDGWVNPKDSKKKGPRKQGKRKRRGSDDKVEIKDGKQEKESLEEKYGDFGKFGDGMLEWLDERSPEFWERCQTTDEALDPKKNKTKKQKKTKETQPEPELDDDHRKANKFADKYALTQLTGHGFEKEAPDRIELKRKGDPWEYRPKTEAKPPTKSRSPGYVFGTLVTSTESLAKTVERYQSQVWDASKDSGLGRTHLVIGLNLPEPLGNKGDPGFEKPDLDVGFPCTVVPFTWTSGFHKGGKQNERCTIEDVREALGAEPPAVQKIVEAEFYQGRFDEESKMGVVPYGALREEILPEMKTAAEGLSKTCSPVYLHLGDPDAVDWHVNGGEVGILAAMDQFLSERDRSPAMISGGYNFGNYDEKGPPQLNALRLGNEVDRAARSNIAEVMPQKAYPTEPNLFVKACEDGDTSPKSEKGSGAYKLFDNKKLFDQNGRAAKLGAVMGVSNAEGAALRTSVFKAQELSDNDYAYSDTTITTNPPGRILDSVKGTTSYARLVGNHKQSHGGSGIDFRNKPPKGKKKVWDEIKKRFHERLETEPKKES